MIIKELIPDVKRTIDKNVKYSLLNLEYSSTQLEIIQSTMRLGFWASRQESFDRHESEYPNDSYPKCKTCRDGNGWEVDYPCSELVALTKSFLKGR